MQRLGSQDAILELSHAPIMEIPGLASDAPVPLRVTHGQIGTIGLMQLGVRGDPTNLRLSGEGHWRWHNSADTEIPCEFDPQTRLAEPAFVQGFAVLNDATQSTVMSVTKSKARRVTVHRELNQDNTEELCQLIGADKIAFGASLKLTNTISLFDPTANAAVQAYPHDRIVWPVT